MGMTHVINILENKDIQLVAIIDKNPEGVQAVLPEHLPFMTERDGSRRLCHILIGMRLKLIIYK